jgi:methionyl-tRNA formyltransferase
MKCIVAVCGELGFSTLKLIFKNIELKALLTDSTSTSLIEWANGNSIPIFIGNPRKKDFFLKLSQIGDVDILISINYLYLINKELIFYPKLLSMNIHGGKLPKYRGRGPHLRAIINGENEMGITLHKIDEGCDTGNIILQRVIPLSNEITGGEILLGLPKIYSEMILEALDMISLNSLKTYPQNHQLATFYEKLKPEEREINWECNSLQIYNFIRALTYPYPGAYSYLNGKKIIIWKSEIEKKMIDPLLKNGSVIEIISDYAFKIKTCDGVLIIKSYGCENVKISIGDILERSHL